MGLYRKVYLTSLVGVTAGLSSWALASVVCAILPANVTPATSDFVAAICFGAVTGALIFASRDFRPSEEGGALWIVAGCLGGAVVGFLASLLQIPLTRDLSTSAPFLARVVSWAVVGSLIGLAMGLPWVGMNRVRLPYGFTGGLLGGTLGGILFAGLGGRIPDLAHAVAFMLMGTALFLGIALAPVMLRYGRLVFVSSGDPRAHSKLGRGKKEWEIEQGHTYVIGSQAGDARAPTRQNEVEIFVPDSAIAPRHAIVFGRQGRFFVARHPEAGGQAGLARYVLRLRGQTVRRSAELRDADDILVGRTALKFVSRARSME